MEQLDCIVIGAGAIGLAIARALSPHRQLMVLEQHGAAFTETSSRNSGVIHAGLYYPANTLKTSLCIKGNQALYQYCEQHAIPHQRCGKLVLACNPEETAGLQALQQQAIRNGIKDLHWCTAEDIATLEPDVRATAALLSPNTGIIDSDAYKQQLLRDIEKHQGEVVYHQRVSHIEKSNEGFILTLNDSDKIHCHTLINAAGLHAQTLAAFVCPAQYIPPVHYVKGHYFRYQGKHRFRHLLYPLPSPHLSGLGIHATLSLTGQLRFGPDTDNIPAIDYRFTAQAESFAAAIQRYIPGLDATQLQADFTGIRPKLASAAFSDFQIQGPGSHGIPNYIQLFGMESPGLTASLAIGDFVHQLLQPATL